MSDKRDQDPTDRIVRAIATLKPKDPVEQEKEPRDKVIGKPDPHRADEPPPPNLNETIRIKQGIETLEEGLRDTLKDVSAVVDEIMAGLKRLLQAADEDLERLQVGAQYREALLHVPVARVEEIHQKLTQAELG
jgi:hypothetical protein